MMGCPSGKKPCYTHEDALAAVERHKTDQGFSILETRPQWSEYACPSCEWWHLTSGPGWPDGFGRRLRR